MRDFHMFNPAIWKNKNFCCSLNDSEKLAYLFLSMSHHQSMLGAYYIPDNYAANDLGWSIDDYRVIRKKLRSIGMILYDDATEEVFVKEWFRANPPKNPKHYFGMLNVLRKILSEDIHNAIVIELHKALEERGPPDWFTELQCKGQVAEPIDDEF